MKTSIIYFITIFSLFAIILSCSNDDEKPLFEKNIAYVTSVKSPTSGMINEFIAIEVNFPVYNGCGQFNKFIKTHNENTMIIEVEAKYEGDICTQDIPTRTANYEFIAQNAGDYVLNFRSSETEFITVNLSIN